MSNKETDNIYYDNELRLTVIEKIQSIYCLEVYEFLMKEKHSGIPEIFEIKQEDGELYIKEKYIEGKTLAEYINEKGYLNADETKEIILKLIDILKPLHSLKPSIIHRDIKPANIIIDNYSNIYLIDFNAAKIENKYEERDTVLIGTSGYAAPEQYGFGPSTRETDIFGIGRTMKEMLNGNLEDEIYDGNLNKIINKCLKMDPLERYTSLDELRYAIVNEKLNNSFIPVGFRKRKPLNMIVASLWYLFVIGISATLEVKNAGTLETILNRIAFFLTLISGTVMFGNYRDIHHRLGIKRNLNPFIFWIKIFIYSILTTLAVLVVMILFLDFTVSFFK